MGKLSTSFLLLATAMTIATTMTAQQVIVQEHCIGNSSSARCQYCLPMQMQDNGHSFVNSKTNNLNSDYIRHRIDDYTYEIRPRAEVLQTKRKVAAQTEGTIQVSWEADYDPKSFIPSGLSFINAETHEKFDHHGFGHEAEWGLDAFMNIPAGVYDIYAGFWGAGGTEMYYVIRELVDISSDQHFVISPLEATQTIQSHMLDENGEELQLSIGIRQKNGDFELIEQGNLTHKVWDDLIFIDGALVLRFFHAFDWDSEGRRSSISHISPCSERVMFGSCGYMTDTCNTPIQFLIFTNDTKHCTDISLDPNNYYTISDYFHRSPMGKQSGSDVSIGCETIALLNDVQISDVGGYNYIPIDLNEPITMKVNVGSKELGFKAMSHLILCDLKQTTYEVIEFEDEYGNIFTEEWENTWVTLTYSLPMYIGENGIEYVNKGHDIYGNFTFQIPEDPSAPILEYPGHPVFSYTPEQITDAYGNSCPITALMMQNTMHPWYGTRIATISPCYIGRRGEVRTTDYQSLQAVLLFNDKEIASNYSTLEEDLFRHCLENGVEGLWDLTLVNTNIMVDDLEGKNIVKATFDGSKEDFTSPTLQMLDFRNQDNAIADRFETAEQGTLQFACGDFNLFWQAEGRAFFDCKPVTVKTEYSAYQEEAWTELTSISEKEEYFCRPAFGYFYSGSLAEVDTPSETGWYDLRITLTDEVGNTQEQVISPAFKIGEGTTTSIRSIEQSNDATIYTLQGQKAAKQLSAGFYIANGKKIVKM